MARRSPSIIPTAIGGTAWIFSQTFTGLATSNTGGVGLLEQTIPDS